MERKEIMKWIDEHIESDIELHKLMQGTNELATVASTNVKMLRAIKNMLIDDDKTINSLIEQISYLKEELGKKETEEANEGIIPWMITINNYYDSCRCKKEENE